MSDEETRRRRAWLAGGAGLTAVATIVGRWAVNGEADLPAVRTLQSALTLSPATDHPGRGLPEPDASVPADISFFEQLRVWMRAFPPAPRDLDYQARFEPLGLFRQDSPYADPDSALLAALREGLAHGKQVLEQALTNSPSPKQNGWNLTYHTFDYNLDFFEVGALDDPKWKAETGPHQRYLLRAGAARGGATGGSRCAALSGECSMGVTCRPVADKRSISGA